MKMITAPCFVALLVAASGCGGESGPRTMRVWGDVTYDGKPVEFTGPRDAQAVGIGIIHQELYLMNHMTAAQNIFIGREPRRGFGMFVDEAKLNPEFSVGGSLPSGKLHLHLLYLWFDLPKLPPRDSLAGA